jgi:deoxyribonuclease-4
VRVIHTNDSKGGLGSRLDRHANIGEGQNGLEGFRLILQHPKLRTKAFILETPVDNPGDDVKNVEALKALSAERAAPRRRRAI